MTTTLFKIPCLLVAATSFHIAITPPHPPPTSDEKTVPSILEGLLSQRSVLSLVKILVWAFAIAEIAVIATHHDSHLKPSRDIHSLLAFQDTAGRIRFSSLFLLGTCLAAVGAIIRLRCYRELGRLFTFETTIRKNHRLVTSGPYSIVRHPAYTGYMIATAGTACSIACPGSWMRECGVLETIIGQVIVGVHVSLSLLIILGLMFRMPKEDEALSETFCEEWATWRKRVPFMLIPGVY